MQSYDESGKIVQAQIMKGLEIDRAQDAKEVAARLKQGRLKKQIQDAIQNAENKGAVKHVIANMPNQGQTIEINGLTFKISYVNNRRGDVHLKLEGMKETAEHTDGESA
jgi:Mg2+/Co2+ transporter CorC